MNKLCLHCGATMHSMRNTKKYCSDNCKQLAFYKRSGLQMAGISEPFNVKENVEEMELSENDNEDNYSVTIIPTIKPLIDVGSQQEPVYETVYSTFMDKVMELADNSEAFMMFQLPDHYWRSETITSVKWVSIRLRNLLENLIRISNLPSVSYETLDMLNKVLQTLVASFHFRYLPANYPYTSLITDLQQKLTKILQQHKRYMMIRFRLTQHRKATLIAARFNMADFVPAVKFTDLDFSK